MFRAGPYTASGERVAHGLVVHYGASDCVNDNDRRLEDAAFPVDNSIITFGSHRVYVTMVAEHYPTDVANDDPLPPASGSNLSNDVDDLCRRVEVLTTASAAGAPGHRTPIRAAVEALRTHVP
ncbi:hypothetical protein D1007_01953 [Hordeum vulgare]|nr:hypothetical protein D1007_01953 [Hordeum vulgare]